MLDWIAKYWLEVLFGLIVAGIGVFFKYFLALVRKDREQHNKKILEAIDKKMDTQQDNIVQIINERDKRLLEEDAVIHKEIDELKDGFRVIKSGVLSIQGRDFKADCRMLLDANHHITVNEYEAIVSEHEVYKSLGGNHEGDALFHMVVTKYQQEIVSSH